MALFDDPFEDDPLAFEDPDRWKPTPLEGLQLPDAQKSTSKLVLEEKDPFAALDIKLPDFAMPDFKMPDFKMPDFASNIKLPDFAMPDFKVSDFGTGIKMPDFKMPGEKEGKPEEEHREHIARALAHEMINVYSLAAIFAPYLEPTWFGFREDQMDDILEKSGESLEKPLFKRLNIRPAIISDAGDKEKLFLARFEFPKYGADLKYSEAKLPTTTGQCLAWIDFLTGFHYGCCEMLMVVGEVSSKEEEFPSQDGEKGPVPPIPNDFFDERFKEDKILHSYIWIESDNAEGLVDGISGHPHPEGPHWWFRINCVEKQKWPYPGEFLGLGNRIFPNLPWSMSPNDEPAYHPFLYSGMFMDTVFITSALVLRVEEAEEGFCKVICKWREQEITAYPTDFAQYAEGDRVTILKDIKTDKTSEFWDDEDLWAFDKEIWRVAPITYYGKGFSW